MSAPRGASLAEPKPSSLHTTLAAVRSHRWSHTVPHLPSRSTSTRPSPSRAPAFRRTAACGSTQTREPRHRSQGSQLDLVQHSRSEGAEPVGVWRRSFWRTERREHSAPPRASLRSRGRRAAGRRAALDTAPETPPNPNTEPARPRTPSYGPQTCRHTHITLRVPSYSQH